MAGAEVTVEMVDFVERMLADVALAKTVQRDGCFLHRCTINAGPLSGDQDFASGWGGSAQPREEKKMDP